VDQPTYSQFLVDIERFDEKNTVFSRTVWDEEFQVLIQESREKAPKDDWDRIEGKALTAVNIQNREYAKSFGQPGHGHRQYSSNLFPTIDQIQGVSSCATGITLIKTQPFYCVQRRRCF